MGSPLRAPGEKDGFIANRPFRPRAMRVLVVGATGTLGADITAALIRNGHAVRGIARPTSDPAKVERLRSLKVELVAADLKDPSSLTRACRGQEAVVTTASTTFSRQPGDSIETVDQAGQLSLIEAVKEERVRRMIYVSFSGGIDQPFPLRDAKRTVEAQVKSSGVEYSILRPSYFMEVWLSPALGFDVAASTAKVYGSGKNPVSWISLHDVTRFAVAALEDPAASRNRVLELGGPRAVSPLDVVAAFERQTGRKFDVQYVPIPTLTAQRDAAGDSLQKSFAGLCLCVAAGDTIDMAQTLKEFPVALTSVEEYARAVSTSAGPPLR